MTAPAIYQIKLLVETDDPAELDRLADEVGRVACPHEAQTDHACSLPWFVITSPVDDPEEVRDLLNR